MSLGFSIGDVIAIGQLTWTVYRACKGAPGEFQELARELSTLHTILHELEDDAKNPNSLLNRRGESRRAELDLLLRNLSGVLEEIEDIVNRYHNLGGDQKKTWDRVKFATRDVAGLRAKIQFHISAINLFMSSLSAGSLARIEVILEQLVKDVRAGRKEQSIISTSDRILPTPNNNSQEEIPWNELEKELVGDGITKQDVETHRDDIKTYLLQLIKENNIGPGSADPALELSVPTPKTDLPGPSEWNDASGTHHVRNRRRPASTDNRANAIPFDQFKGDPFP